MNRFPVGGPRDAVYAFLRNHGFTVTNFNDKQWKRADGLELHLYGSGSKARIYDKDRNLVADDALAAAVEKVKL